MTYYGYYPKNDLESYLEIKSLDSYPKDVLDEIYLLTINEKFPAEPFGSYIYRAQKYPGDIDLIENIQPSASIEDIINQFIKQLIKKIKQIKKERIHYFSEFKAGEDLRYNIDIGTLVDGKYSYTDDLWEKLSDLKKIDLLNEDEINLIRMGFENPNFSGSDTYDIIKKILRERKILRWSETEVLKKKKILPGGKIVSLFDALIQENTQIKLDIIAYVENKFIEVTNFFVLARKLPDETLEPINLNLAEVNTVGTLKADIEKLYYSNMYYSIFKMIKRLYSLGRKMKQYDTLEKIIPVLSSSISEMYQIKSEIESIERIYAISKSVPKKTIIKQVEIIKDKLSRIIEISSGRSEIINLYINLYVANGDIKNLSKIKPILKNLINFYSLRFLSENNINPPPKYNFPDDFTYDPNIKRDVNLPIPEDPYKIIFKIYSKYGYIKLQKVYKRNLKNKDGIPDFSTDEIFNLKDLFTVERHDPEYSEHILDFINRLVIDKKLNKEESAEVLDYIDSIEKHLENNANIKEKEFEQFLNYPGPWSSANEPKILPPLPSIYPGLSKTHEYPGPWSIANEPKYYPIVNEGPSNLYEYLYNAPEFGPVVNEGPSNLYEHLYNAHESDKYPEVPDALKDIERIYINKNKKENKKENMLALPMYSEYPNISRKLYPGLSKIPKNINVNLGDVFTPEPYYEYPAGPEYKPYEDYYEKPAGPEYKPYEDYYEKPLIFPISHDNWIYEVAMNFIKKEGNTKYQLNKEEEEMLKNMKLKLYESYMYYVNKNIEELNNAIKNISNKANDIINNESNEVLNAKEVNFLKEYNTDMYNLYIDYINKFSNPKYILSKIKQKAMRFITGRSDEILTEKELNILKKNDDVLYETYTYYITHGNIEGMGLLDPRQGNYKSQVITPAQRLNRLTRAHRKRYN